MEHRQEDQQNATCALKRCADKIRRKVRGNPIGIRNRYLKPGEQGAEKKVGAVSTYEVPSYNTTSWMRLQKAAAEHGTASQT